MSTKGSEHEVEAGEADAGERLDRVLARALPELSRARLQELIRAGRVTSIRSGAALQPSAKVRLGDRFRIDLPPPEPAGPAPEAHDLVVAYEDAHLIVVDKPAGMVVHPAPGHAGGTLVNALLAHCGESLSGIGGVRRPGIVHRLDKDTSGLIVAAKTDAAHKGLARQFAAHGRDGAMRRTYLAVVWGVPEPRGGTIDAPLARSPTNRLKFAVPRTEGIGRQAITHYEVLETFQFRAKEPVASLVACRLETGRTHQIRVHMAHIRHPLLADTVYGAGFAASRNRLGEGTQAALDRLGRQALHAAELGFVHPATRRRLDLESPLPAELAELVALLRRGA